MTGSTEPVTWVAIWPMAISSSSAVRTSKSRSAAIGKVDYAALPAAELRVEHSVDGIVLPRSALEQALAWIWQELLEIPQIGIRDHFFGLGGDSLLAVRM